MNTWDKFGMTKEEYDYSLLLAANKDLVDEIIAESRTEAEKESDIVLTKEYILRKLKEKIAAKPRLPVVYRTSSITRYRKPQNDIQTIRRGLYEILVEQNPMTVRQVFYQMTTRGFVEKTEAEYRQTVCRLLTKMRLDGSIPFGWIADNTRWMRKPKSYTSLSQSLRESLENYKRDVWEKQAHYVEVWIEKDALAGVIYKITANYDVPLMVTRGYPSISYLYEAAHDLEMMGKPAYIYYMGDYDPSGLDISRSVEKRLREFAPNTELHFERIAVTLEQIQSLHLPTRPTKITDTRARNFNSESVELDSIEPSHLRGLIMEQILKHIDGDEWGSVKRYEDADRHVLEGIVTFVEEDDNLQKVEPT